MKKLLVIAVATLMSASVFASKARVAALQNAAHLNDSQNIFTQPDQLHALGEWANFEFGDVGGTNNRAQGGLTHKTDGGLFGLILGYQSPTHSALINASNGTTGAGLLKQENPLNLFYGSATGDLKWAVGLQYSSSDKKTAKKKQSTTGLVFGASEGAWYASLALGLASESKNETSNVTYKGTSQMALNGGYKMDDYYWYGNYIMGGGKTETGSTESRKDDSSSIEIGAIKSMKMDVADLFWGASYKMTTSKPTVATVETKTETTILPVIIGVEADVNSWMVARASVTQNVFIGSTKTGSGDADSIDDNTKIAAGIGLKFGKLTLDGTLANAGGTGVVGSEGGSFLANGSLTYNF